MKENNYIVVQGWMLTKLGLKGNDLLCYALIYGFSQDGSSKFTGSLNYICNWLNCTKNTAMKSLSYLVDKNLITKESTIINGVKFNSYVCGAEIAPVVQKTYECGAKNDTGGGAKIAPNNIYNNINNNIYVFDFEKSLIELGIEKQIAKDWIKVRKNKKGSNTETAFNSIKNQIELSKLTPNECIKICVENSWAGFKAEWVANIKQQENKLKTKELPDYCLQKETEWMVAMKKVCNSTELGTKARLNTFSNFLIGKGVHDIGIEKYKQDFETWYQLHKNEL